MAHGWQDAWLFRIVDQDTGAGFAGVPVTVLDDGGRSVGFFVSDVDGIVRIPKHTRPRLRLRVGLRSEDTIELDARSLPDDPVPLAAPHGGAAAPEATTATAAPAAPDAAPLAPPAAQPGQVLRFARIGILPQDEAVLSVDPAANNATALRYGILLEVDQIWQSLGSQAGDALFSISLGPGDEAQVAVMDGRWRRKPDIRDRPLQIVAKMVAAPLLGDGVDAVPLEAFVVDNLQTAATDTVRYLSQRTGRMCDSLRRRPLGVVELEGERPAGATVRTVRNMRSDGVLTYDFVEPVARYRVIARTPQLRPAVLVPFRLPKIATRDVVRRFGHVLRRALLDRALLPDIEQVLGDGTPPAAVERRLYAHITSHLPYYSATIIAAGDPAERFFALAKLQDGAGRALTDVIENVVVGRVGNYVAFPLRSAAAASPEWQSALAGDTTHHLRASQEIMVTLPLPGVWLRARLSPALVESEPVDSAAVEREAERGRRLGGAGGSRRGD